MNLQPLAMDITLGVVATLVLILEIIGIKNKRTLAYVALAGLVLTALSGICVFQWMHSVPPGTTVLGGSFIVDPLAMFFKFVALSVTFMAILISVPYVEKETPYTGEFYALILFVALGMVVMPSVGDLITLFIAIEFLSMPMYALAAYLKFNKQSSEAGLKFFILGAVSSAFYLYGASMVYATLKTIKINEFTGAVLGLQQPTPLLILGIVCIVAVFAFKIAVAPFHMWAPDVYQGSPTPVTAFLSTGPKAAGMVIIMRFFLGGFNVFKDGMPIRQDWVMMIMVLSMLSMIVGNLVALSQTNIKRMLAFSGISHMGYILIGIAAAGVGGPNGAAASMFYIALYTFTTLGAWGVAILVGLVTGSEEIKDFAGLSKRSPGLAMVLFLAMLSLAGVPPLAGFVGKFYLFTAAWERHLYLLVIFGMINSVISLYYYLGVLRAAYFDPAPDQEPIPVPILSRVALGISTIAMVCLALFPPLTTWTVQVATQFLGS